jgi:hypothetical protein
VPYAKGIVDEMADLGERAVESARAAEVALYRPPA